MSSLASFASLLRRFRRNRNGSAIVEFAIIAPMFFALLFAILETAMVFFAGQVLETITQDSARLILTGQAQQGNFSQAAYRNQVCSMIPALFDCTQMAIDVTSYTSFSSIALNNPIDAGGNYTPPNGWSCGGPGSIVVVRITYPWQLFVTGLGYNISNFNGNKRLLVATAAFQNEPYTGGACT
jgi:Flp pilus assembly protein TadG